MPFRCAMNNATARSVFEHWWFGIAEQSENVRLSPRSKGRGARAPNHIRARWNIPADDVKHRKEKSPKAFVV